MKNLKKAGMPIQPKSLKAFLEKSCEQFRHKLVKEYEIFLFFIDYEYSRRGCVYYISEILLIDVFKYLS